VLLNELASASNTLVKTEACKVILQPKFIKR